MALHWFHPTVYIKDPQPGMTAGISNAEGAAEALLTFTKRGAKWRAAVNLAMAVISDEEEPNGLSRVFEAAAKAEGILRQR